ncbi:hypothetical protein GQ43DRAFT_59279 [Delitschia confertaspora ATCC 74209]|uniref:Uncharacterized protein n=1 Tax=Delitschia confertaspora ATCC 74209 TaxID=1513339 RepID=A0A9P4JU08_9PLEO|nr:hypothetical protein GQ43DRAFT_59279 [Delitschia confertaspora ATCC 74209]
MPVSVPLGRDCGQRYEQDVLETRTGARDVRANDKYGMELSWKGGRGTGEIFKAQLARSEAVMSLESLFLPRRNYRCTVNHPQICPICILALYVKSWTSHQTRPATKKNCWIDSASPECIPTALDDARVHS